MCQKLTDEQYKAIVKGQMLQQIKAYQQQAAMMHMQASEAVPSFSRSSSSSLPPSPPPPLNRNAKIHCI